MKMSTKKNLKPKIQKNVRIGSEKEIDKCLLSDPRQFAFLAAHFHATAMKYVENKSN